MSGNLGLIFPFVSNNYTKNTLPSEGTIRHENQAFGSKDFAIEPCNKKSSHQRVQKYLKPNAKFSQKKRKFDSNIIDDKISPTLGFITREKRGNKNAIQNEKVGFCHLHRQDYTHLGDSDNFIVKLNPKKQGQLKALESLVNEDPSNSRGTSHLLRSKNKDTKLNQPQNEESHVPRLAIPIGPRFQAKVPKWEGTSNLRYDSNDELKWLGVQLWPMPDFSESKSKVVGKGRHDSCSCESPGSIDCNNLHISEARELLKLEIGKTFSGWKFDEMGEDVSKGMDIGRIEGI